MSFEDDLKATLERHSRELRATPDPLALAMRRLARARRRNALALTAVIVLAISGLAVALPKLASRRAEPIGPRPVPSELVTVPPTAGAITRIHRASLYEGWVIRDGEVLTTKDGGMKWTRAFSTLGGTREALDVDSVGSTLWIVHTLKTALPPQMLVATYPPGCFGATSVSVSCPIRRMTTPPPPNGAYGGASIDMLDSHTGWVLVDLGGSTNTSNGALLRTTDGKTWRKIADTPSGRVHFVDAHNGWIVGGAGGGRLYYTSDGGKTWKNLQPRDPQPGCTNDAPAYGPPVFAAGSKGWLPLSYSCTDGSKRSWAYEISTLVDTGNHRAIPLSGQNDVVFATPDGKTLFASQGGRQLAISLDRGGMWDTLTPQGFPTAPGQLSFADALHGWTATNDTACADPAGGKGAACTAISGLYATNDGGRTWRAITITEPRGPR